MRLTSSLNLSLLLLTGGGWREQSIIRISIIIIVVIDVIVISVIVAIVIILKVTNMISILFVKLCACEHN